MKRKIGITLLVICLIITSAIPHYNVYAKKNKFITNKKYAGSYDATNRVYSEMLGAYAGYYLDVDKITKKSKIFFRVGYVSMYGRIIGTDTIKVTIKGNKAKFKWYDIFQHEGARGTGTLVFLKNGKVKVKLKETQMGISMSLSTNGKYIKFKKDK